MGVSNSKSIITDGLVLYLDTANPRSYPGEPTTNVLPSGVAFAHGAYGNVATITDAPEKGDGWKKVNITTRGTNFRILQWTYYTYPADTMVSFSMEIEWGNLATDASGEYDIHFDGNGGGTPNFYAPGNTSTSVGSSTGLITANTPEGKWYGTMIRDVQDTKSFFLCSNTYNDTVDHYFYYRYYQVEVKTHATQWTSGTRPAINGWKDLSGKNNHSDLTNATYNSDAQLDFNGSSAYVNCGNSNLFSITKYVSVFAWINLNNVSGYNGVFGAYSGGEFIHFQPYNQSLNFYLYGPGFGGTNAEVALESGVWCQVGLTYDGNTARLFKNGIQMPTTYNAASPATNISSTANVSIGRVYSADRFCGGKIPVVSIYNKNLSQTEITQNFNALRLRYGL